MMAISTTDLLKRKVVDAAGRAIGEIESVLFDPASWQITRLRVKLRRGIEEHAGVHAPFFGSAHIDIPTNMVQGVSDAVLLSVSLEALSSLASTSEAAST